MAKLEHDRINLGRVAQQLEDAKTTHAEGNVTFEAFGMNEAAIILSSCVTFSAPIPAREKEHIIHQAIFDAGRAGTITKQTIERHVAQLEKKYLQQPFAPYVLATSLSIRTWPWRLPERINISGATIRFSRELPKRFDRSALATKFPADFADAEPKDFVITRVSVSARSTDEAADNAFDALDLLRGIWNLSLNRTILTRLFTGRPRPVNRVLLGPVHTLHHPDGKIATQTYWFDPFYRPVEAAHLHDPEWSRVEADAKAIRTRLARVPYAADLRDIIIRYTRTLDSADFERAFLKLWTLLEALTDATASKGYDTTIKRALFIWKDSELTRPVLEHLRTYRNANVHSGYYSHQVESFTLQLKRYVEELLLFHLFARPAFASLHAAGEYFELPRDPDLLRNRIDLLERALRFRKQKPRRKPRKNRR